MHTNSGMPYWLKHQTHDQKKVVSWNPGRSSRRFFSPELNVCVCVWERERVSRYGCVGGAVNTFESESTFDPHQWRICSAVGFAGFFRWIQPQRTFLSSCLPPPRATAMPAPFSGAGQAPLPPPPPCPRRNWPTLKVRWSNGKQPPLPPQWVEIIHAFSRNHSCLQ